jgi:NADH-quinone oxidoreductase subunit L
MFRLWYLAFLGKPRSPELHAHESPWSMGVPLVILGLLSLCGGWIGAGRMGSWLAPAVGTHTVEAASNNLEITLSVLAVLVAALGWLIAHLLYREGSRSAAKLATSLSGPYNLLLHKYWVDEFYSAIFVKPVLAISRFVLEWIVEFALLGGITWLLAGTASFGGAVLQRWQSGNLRSYAGWLAAGAAVLLLFALAPYFLGHGISMKWAGW